MRGCAILPAKGSPKSYKTCKIVISREIKKPWNPYSHPLLQPKLEKNSYNLSAGNLILLIAVAIAQLFSVSFSMTSSIFHRLMTWPLKITLY